MVCAVAFEADVAVPFSGTARIYVRFRSGCIVSHALQGVNGRLGLGNSHTSDAQPICLCEKAVCIAICLLISGLLVVL